MIQKKERIVLLILLLLGIINSQNSICYSNCKEGYCQPEKPYICTSCDSGQVNLYGKCVPGSSQPFPLKYLTVNDNNTNLLDSSGLSFQFFCNVTSFQIFTQRILGSIIYESVPGTTFTKQFNILERHEYLQIKFNAAILQSTTVILQFDLIDVNGVTIFSQRRSNTPPNDSSLSLVCSPDRSNNSNSTINVRNVFFVKQSLSSSENIVILQIKSLDSTGIFGVSNIQLSYGSCHFKCKTCTGPSQSQCLTCQGFYMTIVNGTCQTCPVGLYDSGTQCRSCPANCESCQFNNLTKTVFCTSCLPQTKFQFGQCISIFQFYALPPTLIYQSADGWTSSQVNYSPLTRCGKYSLIGGISIGREGSIIQKTFTNLKVHDTVDIKFIFFSIDQQLDQQSLYQIYVDGQIIAQKQFTINSGQSSWILSNECGQDRPELSFIVKQQKVPHNKRNLTIGIRGFKSWFGIRDFNLVVNNKTSIPGCYQVNSNNTCTSCLNGYELGNISQNTNSSTTTPSTNSTTNQSIIVVPFDQVINLIDMNSKICTLCPNNYYMTTNKINNKQCQLCPIQCKTCKYETQQILCTSCVTPLELINNQCKDKSHAIYSRQIIPQSVGMQKNQWITYPKLPSKGLSSCGGNLILGSDQVKYKFLSMKREWNNLPAHRGIKVYFEFFQIDTYFSDSVIFKLNGKQYPYTPRLQRKKLCGDQQALDAMVKIELPSEGLTVQHTSNSLVFEVIVNGKIKVGISNVILFLLNCQSCNNKINFKLQTIPQYSVATPPQKGARVKLIFDEKISNYTPISQAFQFYFKNQEGQTSRLLQDTGLKQYANSIPIVWQKIISNKEYIAFLDLDRDYLKNNIVANPSNYLSIVGQSQGSNNQTKTVNSMPLEKNMPRYIELDQKNIDNRKNIRNLRNLFEGCAIVALWIGLASFIFGFSPAFDDFFILIQLIFVHIFIQLAYSPPSFRIPLEGMKIVQFMAWLPWEARQEIQKGIIANDLYQRSPIQYQQYYKDIVFARTIYHTILFIAIMAVIFILLRIFSHIVSERSIKKKYVDSYFVKFYNDYQGHRFSFIDKVIRFSYFTVVWACTLQFIYFQNEPRPFHIWNSVLCIFMFVLFVLYPIVGFFYLRYRGKFMSEATFNKNYSDVRINSERLYHFIWRYYKLLIIALLIGLLYAANPLSILIPLIIIHIVDGFVILFLQPFGMVQQKLLNVYFQDRYPTGYTILSAIQSFLFAILELFILITYAVRDNASNSSYLALGYVCCAFVVLLLLNGVIRMVWGFIKIFEQCVANSKQMKLNVQNKMIKQKQDNNQQIIPIKSNKDLLQTNLGTTNRMRMNSTRRPSYISKIN